MCVNGAKQMKSSIFRWLSLNLRKDMNGYKTSHWQAWSSLAFPSGSVTITLVNDKLNPLAEANYSDGGYYRYAMDTQYFLGDALGSVRQLTDSTGAVSLANIYDPYGVVSAKSGPGETSYGYANEYQDNSEFVYLRARQYSPGLGRFLTRDTWGFHVPE